MSSTPTSPDTIAAPAQRRARRRRAEAWLEEEVEFWGHGGRVRSRTIVIERRPAAVEADEPAAPAAGDPGVPEDVDAPVRADTAIARAQLAAAGLLAAVRRIPTLARAGAQRLGYARRAGLPPARERHLDRPRITPPVSVRRPRRNLYERIGSRPDRIVLWAVALGAFLIVIAAASSSS